MNLWDDFRPSAPERPIATPKGPTAPELLAQIETGARPDHYRAADC
jgi:hypothetical protein